MTAVLEKAATIYGKGQTTVPIEVRKSLGVEAGDSVTFRVEGDGTVTVRKADGDADPALAAFLGFLADDIRRRPRAIRGLTASLEGRLQDLIAETAIDREADRIEGDVGL